MTSGARRRLPSRCAASRSLPDHRAVLVDRVHPVKWNVRNAFIALARETIGTWLYGDRREWNNDVPMRNAIVVGQRELPVAEVGVPPDAIE
jgi:hypothetical protein